MPAVEMIEQIATKVGDLVSKCPALAPSCTAHDERSRAAVDRRTGKHVGGAAATGIEDFIGNFQCNAPLPGLVSASMRSFPDSIQGVEGAASMRGLLILPFPATSRCSFE